jgi:serine/threonine protein kinase
MNAVVLAQGSPATRGQRSTYLRDNKRYQFLRCEVRAIGTQLYRARDLHREGQVVAIKRLETSHFSLERFFGELRMMQHLNQRYPDLAITSVIDWFWSARAWYLVMRFVEGQSLEAVRVMRGGTLPTDEVLQVGLDLCAILSVLHLHERPVIHRDIKASNVLRGRDGRIVLADFGTACFVDSPIDALFRGTWRYAAPEQRGGLPVTPAADIYGLGVTLYELLTGHLPVESGLTTHDQAFGQLPRLLQQTLKQMMERDPRRRQAGMGIVETALRDALQELPTRRGTERCS